MYECQLNYRLELRACIEMGWFDGYFHFLVALVIKLLDKKGFPYAMGNCYRS